MSLFLPLRGSKAIGNNMFTTYLNYALKRVIRDLLSGEFDVLNQSGTMFLDQPIGEDKEGGELLLGDTITDGSTAAAFEEIEGQGQFVPLHRAVDSLSRELREVIREYYFDGLNYRQIGERHGYSKQRAQQIHNKALRELRNNQLLRALYGEDYGFYRSPIRHKSLAAFITSGTSEVEDYVFHKLNGYL